MIFRTFLVKTLGSLVLFSYGDSEKCDLRTLFCLLLSFFSRSIFLSIYRWFAIIRGQAPLLNHERHSNALFCPPDMKSKGFGSGKESAHNSSPYTHFTTIIFLLFFVSLAKIRAQEPIPKRIFSFVVSGIKFFFLQRRLILFRTFGCKTCPVGKYS